MKQFSLITLCAVILASCASQIPRPLTDVTVDFTYTSDGQNVTFTNNSSPELKAYQWLFGDNTYVFNKETVTHPYKNTGTYEVSLTCKDKNGYPYECTKTITVGTGHYNKAYIVGFKLYDAYVIVSDPIYFRFECIGHGLMGGTNPVIKTAYTTNDITPDDLPYTMSITPVEVGESPNPFDWYSSFDIRVFYAANKNADGLRILNVSVPGSDLDGKTEYIAEVENGTKVGLLIKYQ